MRIARNRFNKVDWAKAGEQALLNPFHLISKLAAVKMSTKPENSSLLHPESARFLTFSNVPGIPKLYEVPLEKARRMFEKGAVLGNKGVQRPLHGKEYELTIPAPSTSIVATVYHPDSAKSDPAICLFYHGGGFVVGSRKTHEMTCRILSEQCGMIIVNVEYRLGPEHRIPAGHDDGIATARWIIENKAKIGSANSIVGVMGDSAGGNIAAATAHDVKGLYFQILIYSVTDMFGQFPSRALYQEDLNIDSRLMIWFGKNSMPRDLDVRDPRWNPLNRKDFKHVPEALIITGQVDPLADDSVEYHRKLCTAGVKSDLMVLGGVLHSFFALPGMFPECCEMAFSRIASFVESCRSKKTFTSKL